MSRCTRMKTPLTCRCPQSTTVKQHTGSKHKLEQQLDFFYSLVMFEAIKSDTLVTVHVSSRKAGEQSVVLVSEPDDLGFGVSFSPAGEVDRVP